jgi:hypothetical protein
MKFLVNLTQVAIPLSNDLIQCLRWPYTESIGYGDYGELSKDCLAVPTPLFTEALMRLFDVKSITEKRLERVVLILPSEFRNAVNLEEFATWFLFGHKTNWLISRNDARDWFNEGPVSERCQFYVSWETNIARQGLTSTSSESQCIAWWMDDTAIFDRARKDTAEFVDTWDQAFAKRWHADQNSIIKRSCLVKKKRPEPRELYPKAPPARKRRLAAKPDGKAKKSRRASTSDKPSKIRATKSTARKNRAVLSDDEDDEEWLP